MGIPVHFPHAKKNEIGIYHFEVVWTFMKFKIILNFWGVFGPWRRSIASYTTDERLKNGQEERWRLNLEEINLQIKSSSEKFRRLYLDAMQHSMVDASEVKLLLFTALTDMIDDRETFMKGIDYSYYYEQED